MSRRNEIMLKSVGIDYRKYENGAIGFDYEALMRDAGYSLDEVIAIQRASGVGGTPLKELKTLPASSGHHRPRLRRPDLY